MIPGEIAAAGTALAWTSSALLFEGPAKQFGSLTMNVVRVGVALGWVTLVAALWFGTATPFAPTDEQAGLLAASGIIGYLLGDYCTFRAYAELGAQRAMVLATATPIFATLLAWATLGDVPTWIDLLGTTLIVGGVAASIAARVPGAKPTAAAPRTGAWFALAGSLGQAGGLILSKRALGTGASIEMALGATQVRLIAALAGFALVTTLLGRWHAVVSIRHHPRLTASLALGAFLGPCVGVVCSLYAVSHAHAGAAAAIMALPPVLILPVVAMRGDRITAAAVASALCAVAGAITLALG